MINFQDIQDKTELDISNISDIDIYKFYIGDFEIGNIMLSPLRKETHPSFSIFYNADNEVLLWKDWGLGVSGNSISFVMKLFGLSYRAAVKKIGSDLSGFSSFIGLPNKIIKKPVNIEIKIKNFTEQDLDYWKSYGITKEILDKFRVYSISHYWLNECQFAVYNKLSYAYTSNNFIYKLYFPNSVYRWISQGNQYIQGYDQLSQLSTQTNLLIITKSLKDIMVYYSLGYYAISPNSESSDIEKSLINNLKERFSRMFINYDNDTTGLHFAKKICNQYNLKSFIVPEITGTKDISDYRKIYGESKTKELLNYLLNGV